MQFALTPTSPQTWTIYTGLIKLFRERKQLWETCTYVGRLVCPEGRVSSLNKCNPSIHTLEKIYRKNPYCHLKPGLYFNRRLPATVAYSFVARAEDYGRHRQLSSKCTRILCKHKQSPDRMTKWSIHGIQIQMRIQIRMQFSLLEFTPINNIIYASWMAHTLSACYWVRLYAWVESRHWMTYAYHGFQSFRRCFFLQISYL